MIRVAGLTKVVSGRRLLDGIDLEVAEGEALLLMGTNGSGRSLLLEILSTLVRPTRGEIEIDGIDIVRFPTRVRPKIGYVEQNPEFHDNLTVTEQLRFTAAARGQTAASLESAVGSCLRLAGLSGDTCIAQLSAGQRQQLAMVGALLGEPSVLLIDEGLSQVDPLGRERFCQVLKKRLDHGAKMIAACNAPNSFASLFRHVVFLHRGRIAESGRIESELPDLEAIALDRLQAVEANEI